MNFNDKILDELAGLVVLSLENGLDKESHKRLEELLKSEPLARKYYVRLINIHLGVLDPNNLKILRGQSNAIPDDIELWKALTGKEKPEGGRSSNQKIDDSNTSLKGVDLAEFDLDSDPNESKDPGLTHEMLELLEMERTSPVVEIPQEEPKRELIHKVERDFKWFPGRLSKRRIRFLAAMAASIMVFFGYVYFVPKPVKHPVVAKLSDSLNAVWDNEFEIPDEFGDMLQSRYRLKKGFISILFNNGAKVTVEAPAEISLDSSSDMELLSGKIYASVPQRAHGFTVTAGRSKIVDIGTEFGVEVDSSNTAQLHVTKGKTLLFAGLGEDSEQIEVIEGSAKKVYNYGFVKDINIIENRFVRKFDPKTGLVLKNSKLSLADVIGDGNGFGTGTLEKGIDMLKAEFQKFEGKLKRIVTDDFKYKPFKGHPYIDGVFIPNGGAGPVRVSSEGHVFENCPSTKGFFWAGVMNGAFHLSEFRNIPKTQLSLDGKICGTLSNPAIYITPNQAVTFDLNKIRKDLAGVGVDIESFSAKAGLSGTMLRYSNTVKPRASIYVLVDGAVRFKKIDQQVTDDVLDILVDINPADRFLTIMTLEGTDGEINYVDPLFTEPCLVLK